MTRLYGIVVLCAACGDVVTSTPPVDAAEPDALTCTSSQLACGTCVDPMMDNKHCGDCDTECAGGTACVGGHCVDTVANCHGIQAAYPMAPSGIYTLLNNAQVYCDMGSVKTYDVNLYMAQFDAGPAGYTIISAADLADAGAQAAFIALYNRQGGLKVPTSWVPGNCCFKDDTTANRTFIAFGASQMGVASGSMATCSPASPGYSTSTTFQLEKLLGTIYLNPPLAADFFTTNAASTVTACFVGANPAMFWKVTP